jgi:hemolysin III
MSTIYHLLPAGGTKQVFKILDHASIYLLIAGSYTPFSLLVLGGSTGWLVFGIIWLIALTGISLEAFWVNRSKIVSAIIYVAMS